jgi:hypothetical protein
VEEHGVDLKRPNWGNNKNTKIRDGTGKKNTCKTCWSNRPASWTTKWSSKTATFQNYKWCATCNAGHFLAKGNRFISGAYSNDAVVGSCISWESVKATGSKMLIKTLPGQGAFSVRQTTVAKWGIMSAHGYSTYRPESAYATRTIRYFVTSRAMKTVKCTKTTAGKTCATSKTVEPVDVCVELGGGDFNYATGAWGAHGNIASKGLRSSTHHSVQTFCEAHGAHISPTDKNQCCFSTNGPRVGGKIQEVSINTRKIVVPTDPSWNYLKAKGAVFEGGAFAHVAHATSMAF